MRNEVRISDSALKLVHHRLDRYDVILRYFLHRSSVSIKGEMSRIKSEETFVTNRQIIVKQNENGKDKV